MQFVSTRGTAPDETFTSAFEQGLAPDGGLYVPQSLPSIAPLLSRTGSPIPPYTDLAFEFLRLFDTDHTAAELRAIVDRSHENFDDPANPAPLRQLDDHLHVLELFHGPTLAFKDFGLQLVGNLFEDQIRRTGKHINVLGATSGDTGSAAIHGLAGKEGVNVFILYPKGRISELQERQMTCTGAPNIFPIAIEGSFDDAQHIVKDLFGDLAFKENAGLSAVNSINIARILAQSVYYIHAHNQLANATVGASVSEYPPDHVSEYPPDHVSEYPPDHVSEYPPDHVSGDHAPDFVTPTGNFGNIFAGWLAHRMGLPASRFTIATNRNDILYRLFTSGAYQPGDVHPSFAPSMDIQVASNFERFLYYFLDGDSARLTKLMGSMKEEGNMEIPDFDPDVFSATRSTDEDIVAAIRTVHRKYDYIVDPHTACGFADLDPGRPTLVLSTAHPAKFPDTIESAIGIRPTHPVLEKLKSRIPVSHDVTPTAGAIRDFIDNNAA